MDDCINHNITNLLLTDNNPELQGKTYKNYRIDAPQNVLEKMPDLVIIAVGQKYKNQIKTQLLNDFMIPDHKITFWAEEVFVLGNEIYNCGDMKFKDIQDTSMLVRSRDIHKYLDDTAKMICLSFFSRKSIEE